MNNLFSNAMNAVSKYSYPILLTLFVMWICIGIFPLQCYEPDGLEITLGCDILYREGWTLPPVYSYEYRMQPLTTLLVVCLKHLLPFFSCEQIYSVMTALFSLLFLMGCISFARHITKESKTVVLVAAMLLPEIYAIAMYANTAIPSAAILIWAYRLIGRQRYWQSVMLLVIALLFRLDAVIVYPVVLPLFLYEGKSFKQSIILSAIFGVAVTVIALPLFWLIGADVLSTIDGYERWADIITFEQTFTAIFGFYSLTYFILLPLGLWVVGSRKQWRELFLIVFPIMTVHLFYAEMGNASKHFLYCAPFAIMAGARAIAWLRSVLQPKPILKWACVVFTALYLTLSVRPNRQDCPWLYHSELYNVGIAVPFGSVQVAGRDMALGLGAGRQLLTGDEFMLGSGHLFYSWYIHSIKSYMQQWRKAQKDALDKAGTCHVLTFEYGVSAPPSFEYLAEGYHFRQLENMPKRYRFTISGQGRDIHFWRVFLSGQENEAHAVSIWLKELSRQFGGEDGYALAAPEHYGVWHVLEELTATGQVEKSGGKLYRIKNERSR